MKPRLLDLPHGYVIAARRAAELEHYAEACP